MRIIVKSALFTLTAVLLYLTDIPTQPAKLPLIVQLVPDAEAVLGVRRRTRRRSVAVGYAAGASAASAQAAAQPTAATAAPAGSPATGTTVSTLPDGCTTTRSGVQYYNCGGVCYRAAYQGNSLVYAEAQPWQSGPSLMDTAKIPVSVKMLFSR